MNSLLDKTFTASGTIAERNICQPGATAGTLKVSDTEGAPCVVAISDASTGQAVTARLKGIAEIVSAGAIAYGARVVSAGDGTGKQLPTSRSQDYFSLGKALVPALSAGEIIPVELDETFHPANLETNIDLVFTASGAITAKLAAQVTGAGVVAQVSGSVNGGPYVWPLVDADDGAEVICRVAGRIPAIADGEITAGARIVVKTTGKVTAASGETPPYTSEGGAITAAAADGDELEIMIQPVYVAAT